MFIILKLKKIINEVYLELYLKQFLGGVILLLLLIQKQNIILLHFMCLFYIVCAADIVLLH